MILTAIDAALQGTLAGFDRFALRYYDDLEYFAATYQDAESALLAWESRLAEYELVPNPDKTRIEEAPVPLQPVWLLALFSIPVRSATETAARNYIVNYFDRAFELARRFPKETVISYAIRRFRNWRFTAETWRTYVRLLLPAVIAEPSALPHLAYALAYARVGGLRIDRDRLAETLHELVLRHSALSNGAEVAYSLWIAAEAKLPIAVEAGNAASKSAEDPTALLLLYSRSAGLLGRMADLGPVERLASDPEAVAAGNWLLAYESAHHGWAASKIRKHKQFDDLLDKDVCFFNTRIRTGVDVKTRMRLAERSRTKQKSGDSKAKPKKRRRAGEAGAIVTVDY